MRLYICDRKGARQKCFNKGDLPRKHAPRWALYRCMDCGWCMCRECAREHFKRVTVGPRALRLELRRVLKTNW